MDRTPAHPYEGLPASRFWRSGVADRLGQTLDDLWRPRWPITPATRFATTGSCFAQHISRWLRDHGHAWVDAEPAPADLGAEAAKAAGHGVFSFRTGNIYSAALLRQWLRWTLHPDEVSDEVWEEGGRWYDPFRPGIPEDGYDSREGVLAARRHSLACMREALARTDVFIFTLGLTEAWVDADGTVYPMCPGTLHGRFDGERHRFINQRCDEVVRDVSEAFALMRQCQPALRLLLTVSPVPLTATASGRHVLVATTHSKSVLRAAAGELAATREDVDYFPSYELISSPSSQGRWFEPNLRSVTPQGVAFVMSHFARGLGVATETPEDNGRGAAVNEELVCEDILLSAWSQQPDARPETARLCLLGDSHMGKISQALARRGIAHWGGMIMKGSSWFHGQFQEDAEEWLVPLEGALSRQRWRQTWPAIAGSGAAGERVPPLVITNLGLHTHVSVPAYLQWTQRRHGTLRLDVGEAVVFYREANARLLALLTQLRQRGCSVLAVTDPPTQGLSPQHRKMRPAFEVYERVARHVLQEIGVEVLLAREFLGGEPFDAGYYSDYVYPSGMRDWIHGSARYYDDLVSTLMPVLGDLGVVPASGSLPAAA